MQRAFVASALLVVSGFVVGCGGDSGASKTPAQNQDQMQQNMMDMSKGIPQSPQSTPSASGTAAGSTTEGK